MPLTRIYSLWTHLCIGFDRDSDDLPRACRIKQLSCSEKLRTRWLLLATDTSKRRAKTTLVHLARVRVLADTILIMDLGFSKLRIVSEMQ